MERSHRRNRGLALSWSQQVFNEDGIERLVMVLLNEGCLHIWTEFTRLLLELVDGDLADHEREVLRRRLLHLCAVLIQTHCDVGLVGQAEFLILNDVVDILVFTNCILWTCFLSCLGVLRENFCGKCGVMRE